MQIFPTVAHILFFSVMGTASPARSSGNDAQVRTFAASRLASAVSYRGVRFGDPLCDATFGKAGTVAAKDRRRFSVCLGKLLLRAEDPFSYAHGGSGPTHTTRNLTSTQEQIRLEFTHPYLGVHGRETRPSEESLTQLTQWNSEAVRLFFLRLLPPGIEHRAPTSDIRAALVDGQTQLLVQLSLCVSESGELASCMVAGSKALPAYREQLYQEACKRSFVGKFAPDGVPLEACTTLDISWSAN